MEFIFKVENEIKQDFLSKKPIATAEANYPVLRLADDYEDLIGKSIYNMTYAELREMIAMQFRNTSTKTIIKNVSVLKKYIDFCIEQNIVAHGENRLAIFTAKDAKEFVNRQALISKFVTKEKLREYQNVLFNEQDKLLLELPFIGVTGKGLEEIINLTIDDIDEKKRRLILRTDEGEERILEEIELSTIALIMDAFKQETYVENNGEITSNLRRSEPRELQINRVENYVLKVPGQKKYEKFTVNLLNSRMKRLQKWLDNKYLTFISLRDSGMLQMAMDIYKEKGEVTKDDYIDISVRFNYGTGQPDRYWYVIKALFEQYQEILK
ncbi:MAG: hypothetical protein WDA59_00150 [Methanofastidiosum sp.]